MDRADGPPPGPDVDTGVASTINTPSTVAAELSKEVYSTHEALDIGDYFAYGWLLQGIQGHHEPRLPNLSASHLSPTTKDPFAGTSKQWSKDLTVTDAVHILSITLLHPLVTVADCTRSYLLPSGNQCDHRVDNSSRNPWLMHDSAIDRPCGLNLLEERSGLMSVNKRPYARHPQLDTSSPLHTSIACQDIPHSNHPSQLRLRQRPNIKEDHNEPSSAPLPIQSGHHTHHSPPLSVGQIMSTSPPGLMYSTGTLSPFDSTPNLPRHQSHFGLLDAARGVNNTGDQSLRLLRMTADMLPKCCGEKCNKNFRPTTRDNNDGRHCARCWTKVSKDLCPEPNFVMDETVPDKQAALDVVFQPVRPLGLADDDYAVQGEDHWVHRFLLAMNRPYERLPLDDDWLMDQQHELNKKPMQKSSRGRGSYTNKAVTARTRLLYAAVITYHAGGSYPYPSGGDSWGYGVDTISKCSERLAEIERVLARDKRVCMNVIEGRGVLALAESPTQYAQRKSMNSRSNTIKKNLIEKGKVGYRAAAAEDVDIIRSLKRKRSLTDDTAMSSKRTPMFDPRTFPQPDQFQMPAVQTHGGRNPLPTVDFESSFAQPIQQASWGCVWGLPSETTGHAVQRDEQSLPPIPELGDLSDEHLALLDEFNQMERGHGNPPPAS